MIIIIAKIAGAISFILARVILLHDVKTSKKKKLLQSMHMYNNVMHLHPLQSMI